MTGQFCIPVEHLYKLEPIPTSRLWHLIYRGKVAEKPGNQSPGILHVSDAGGDQVSILFAMPCDEQGEVDADTQAEYEDLADQKFNELRPNAELA